jgi:uncharacterized integral membrane protein
VKNPKTITIAALVLIVLVVVLQNMERTSTDILWMTIEMPRWILLTLTLVIGFALGVITGATLMRRKKSGGAVS